MQQRSLAGFGLGRCGQVAQTKTKNAASVHYYRNNVFVVMILFFFLVPGSKAANSAGSEGAVVYVDLAYLPSGCAYSTVDADFFRCLRSSYYIASGDDPVKEVSMRSILDSLLEGKSSWPEVQVDMISFYL